VPPPAAHGRRREALQRIDSATLDVGRNGKGAFSKEVPYA